MLVGAVLGVVVFAVAAAIIVRFGDARLLAKGFH